jgi:hypothetical protein
MKFLLNIIGKDFAVRIDTPVPLNNAAKDPKPRKGALKRQRTGFLFR